MTPLFKTSVLGFVQMRTAHLFAPRTQIKSSSVNSSIFNPIRLFFSHNSTLRFIPDSARPWIESLDIYSCPLSRSHDFILLPSLIDVVPLYETSKCISLTDANIHPDAQDTLCRNQWVLVPGWGWLRQSSGCNPFKYSIRSELRTTLSERERDVNDPSTKSAWSAQHLSVNQERLFLAGQCADMFRRSVPPSWRSLRSLRVILMPKTYRSILPPDPDLNTTMMVYTVLALVVTIVQFLPCFAVVAGMEAGDVCRPLPWSCVSSGTIHSVRILPHSLQPRCSLSTPYSTSRSSFSSRLLPWALCIPPSVTGIRIP
ncbi:hypothetical protein B0H19DRAFT_198871 [Mycena capillaripes]|nr:hypothetical protein B0H19DRAFT_198871 [Mycena capillaripes]